MFGFAEFSTVTEAAVLKANKVRQEEEMLSNKLGRSTRAGFKAFSTEWNAVQVVKDVAVDVAASVVAVGIQAEGTARHTARKAKTSTKWNIRRMRRANKRRFALRAAHRLLHLACEAIHIWAVIHVANGAATLIAGPSDGTFHRAAGRFLVKSTVITVLA